MTVGWCLNVEKLCLKALCESPRPLRVTLFLNAENEENAEAAEKTLKQGTSSLGKGDERRYNAAGFWAML